ncbi:hypothetical protein [Salegentibacter salegens]|uniref:Uncharacterized protein n=1 Tax=Salegentibacter salegens TaxID=143223 RepID=A0A1M7KVL6_9FLAO|nr:hypothetical protein [Salegentibacter salegens]PRX43812.1 hypothetical protein LY58_02223 [Salegentibacter salegens]SHM69099.1 hypothetical protein SAMN05878281_1607 [Salegentibacter salegens]
MREIPEKYREELKEKIKEESLEFDLQTSLTRLYAAKNNNQNNALFYGNS